MYYENYEEMLEDNVRHCDFNNKEDVVMLVDWLLNEAFKNHKIMNLMIERAKDKHNIDLNNLLTLKDMMEIPLVKMEELDCEDSEFEDSCECDECDCCEECDCEEECDNCETIKIEAFSDYVNHLVDNFLATDPDSDKNLLELAIGNAVEANINYLVGHKIVDVYREKTGIELCEVFTDEELRETCEAGTIEILSALIVKSAEAENVKDSTLIKTLVDELKAKIEEMPNGKDSK